MKTWLLIWLVIITIIEAGPITPGGQGGHAPPPLLPFYLYRKKKKGDKGKKERFSKQKLLKGCHQGQNIIVLPILECLEFKNFFCQPTRVAGNTFQCSMPPPNPQPPPPSPPSIPFPYPSLWNPFHRPCAVVTEMFIRSRKLNISLVFITQSYFKVPKEVSLNTTQVFIMKILNKRGLQKIKRNYSSDINFKDFMKIYKKCTEESYCCFD